MREDDMLRLAMECARLAVAGAPYESALAVGIGKIMKADAGTGVMTWIRNEAPAEASIDVTVAGVDPLRSQDKRAVLSVVARHPTFGSPTWFSGPTHRVSDFVRLPAFWDTDVWHNVHGRGNGRFPAAVPLGRHGHAAVFVGVHRSHHDFDADDMAVLDLIRAPLMPALAFHHAWEAATRRLQYADPPSRSVLTKREAEVLGLIALGWTNARVGRHLQISERTVRKHLENINEKLGTANRAAAVYSWRNLGSH